MNPPQNREQLLSFLVEWREERVAKVLAAACLDVTD